MKKLWMLFSIVIVSLATTACGGGGPPPPSPTSGSIYGTTLPGAIVGIVCYNAPCANKTDTTIADAVGNYSFPGITQVGGYSVYSSHGGYSSVHAVLCSFTSGFFGCQVDMPLSPSTFNPPAGTLGVTFSSASSNSGMSSIPNHYCVSGSCVVGAQTVIIGSSYQWGDSPGSYTDLSYDSVHDTIRVILSPSGGLPSGDGMMCGVSSTINVNGKWYYPCSYFGIAFNRGAGTLTFTLTPLYHIYDSVAQYGVAYPDTHAINNPVASGSLTFTPF